MGGASPESAIYSGENLATGVPRFVLDNAVPDRERVRHRGLRSNGGVGQYDVECNLGWSVGNIISR